MRASASPSMIGFDGPNTVFGAGSTISTTGAHTSGVGVVAVRNSNFFGANAYFINMAAEAGMGTLVARFPEIVDAITSSTTTDIPLSVVPDLIEIAVSLDLDDVARVLEQEGVAAFSKSFDELLTALESKADTL